MATSNFDICTEWLLIHEGGYVDHPKDPGGATNMGVTQAVYDGYRINNGGVPQNVALIQDDEVKAIYREQYWDKLWGEQLPSGVDYAMYDFAVNSGVTRSVKFTQEIVGVMADGVMGNVTLMAIKKMSDEHLIESLCLQRMNWLKRLRTFSTFGRGWTRRVMGDIIEGIQVGTDSGVIDRAVFLSRKLYKNGAIPAPLSVDDGANTRTETEHLKATAAIKQGANVNNFTKIGAGALPGAIGSASMLPEGPLQYAIAAIAVILTILLSLYVYKKFIK
tara:strand:+ start:10586 stop:11413 length:828 start_codon:yes stop_codon:yes gene_type:complete